MDLAAHQRVLLGLVRSSYQVRADDDDYFHRVANSKDLEEARGNIFLWRVYVLERTCVLTVALLRRQQQLESALQTFIQRHNISPFREFQPLAFLASLAGHPDHLVASVSQFELALMQVRNGDPACHIVPWQIEPQGVLMSLAQGSQFETGTPVGAYTTRISRDLPFLFEIDSVGERPASIRTR
jgi:hypothetical protein